MSTAVALVGIYAMIALVVFMLQVSVDREDWPPGGVPRMAAIAVAWLLVLILAGVVALFRGAKVTWE